MDYGKRLTALMLEKGLTQYRMSKITGIAQSQIGRYAHGENEPGISALVKLCDALGVSETEFLHPEPFDVMIDGEIIPLKLVDCASLQTVSDEMQDLTAGELRLVEGIVKAIKEQRANR